MKKLRQAFLALILAASILVISPAPSSAAGPNIHIIQFNMKGRQSWALVSKIVDIHPTSITAQEVCGSEFSAVDSVLGSQGYHREWFGVIPSPAGSNPCVGYGSMYLFAASRGVQTGAKENHFSGYSLQGFVCIRTTYILLSWETCSSHLHGTDAAAAVDQAQKLRQLNPFPGVASGTRLVGVDMNRRPCQTGPLDWYWGGGWIEADQSNVSCSNTSAQATHDSGTKIDYIWSKSENVEQIFGVTVKYTNASDHHLIWGAFNWK